MKIIAALLAHLILFAGTALALEDVKFTSDKKLSAYSTLIISDFDIKDVEINQIDAEEMKKLQPMMPELVKGISTSVQAKVKSKTKFSEISLNGSQKKNAVRLEGKVLKLNGGIGGVKWLLGFATPKNARTYIAVTGRLVDVETGKEIGSFNETNTGQNWGKNFADYFPEMSQEIGESIAEYIAENY